MSSILDALNKLEQDKARAAREGDQDVYVDPAQAARELVGESKPPTRRIQSGPAFYIAGAVLLMIVMIGASVAITMLLMGGNGATQTAANPGVEVPAQAVAAVVPPAVEPIAVPAELPVNEVEAPVPTPESAAVVVPVSEPPSEAPAPNIETSNPVPVQPAPAQPEPVATAAVSVTPKPKAPPETESVPAVEVVAPTPEPKPAPVVALQPQPKPEPVPERKPEPAPEPVVVTAAEPTPQRPIAEPVRVAQRPLIREERPVERAPRPAPVAKDIRSLPPLTPAIVNRYSSEPIRLNMVSPGTPTRPYAYAIINRIKVTLGDRVGSSRFRLVEVESHGVAVEASGERYYVPF